MPTYLRTTAASEPVFFWNFCLAANDVITPLILFYETFIVTMNPILSLKLRKSILL
jgi:hypothetical protein